MTKIVELKAKMPDAEFKEKYEGTHFDEASVGLIVI